MKNKLKDLSDKEQIELLSELVSELLEEKEYLTKKVYSLEKLCGKCLDYEERKK